MWRDARCSSFRRCPISSTNRHPPAGLWNLYKNYEIPRFSVRAIPAFISDLAEPAAFELVRNIPQHVREHRDGLGASGRSTCSYRHAAATGFRSPITFARNMAARCFTRAMTRTSCSVSSRARRAPPSIPRCGRRAIWGAMRTWNGSTADDTFDAVLAASGRRPRLPCLPRSGSLPRVRPLAFILRDVQLILGQSRVDLLCKNPIRC